MKRAYSTAFRQARGMTLAELMVASGVMVVFLASIYLMNSQMISVVRSSRNQSSASNILQERVEQLRIEGWSRITSKSGVEDLMSQPMQTEATGWVEGVSNPIETVTITSLNPGTFEPTNGKIVATRSQGYVSVETSGSFAGERLAKLDLQISWEEMGRDVAPRSLSSTISKSGMTSASIAKSAYEPVSISGAMVASAAPTATPTTYSPESASSGSADRDAASAAPSSSPSDSPTPTPAVCRHGRPWPHCSQP